MKRSDMIKILEKHLKGCEDFPDDFSKAQYLLGEIEQLGMLPPKWIEKSWDGLNGFDYDQHNTWELE